MIRKFHTIIKKTAKSSDLQTWTIIFSTGLLTSITYIIALVIEILHGFGNSESVAMLAGAIAMMAVNLKMLMKEN